MTLRRGTLARASAALAMVVGATGAQAQGYTFEVVVKTGDNLPAPEEDLQFTNLFDPVPLNDGGEVSFEARVSDNTVGLFFGNGALSTIARSGTQPPGTMMGETLSGFGNPDLSAGTSDVAFGGRFDPEGEGLFTTAGGQLRKIALDGETPPDAGSPFTSFDFSLRSNNAGQTVFGACFDAIEDCGGVIQGVFVDSTTPPGLRTVALTGGAAPDGGTFGTFNLLRINGSGDVAFLDGSLGIFQEVSAVLQSVARVGGVPPLRAMGNFLRFEGLSINDAGELVFGAILENPDSAGIFKRTNGTLEVVALRGQEVPDPVGNITLVDFTDPVINGDGVIAFRANNDNEVVVASNGTLSSIASSGEVAPGTGSTFAAFVDLALNSLGQLVFEADLASNVRGVFVFDPLTGEIRKVVAVNDQILVDTNDTRTTSEVNFDGDGGRQDGRDSGVNDVGNVVFFARFADNSVAIIKATDDCGGVVAVNNAVTDPGVRNRLLDSGCLQDIIDQAVASASPCTPVTLARAVTLAVRSLQLGGDLTPQDALQIRIAATQASCP